MSFLLRRHSVSAVEEYSVLRETEVVGRIVQAQSLGQHGWSWAITIGETSIPGDCGYAKSLLAAHEAFEKAWPIIADILKTGM